GVLHLLPIVLARTSLLVFLCVLVGLLDGLLGSLLGCRHLRVGLLLGLLSLPGGLLRLVELLLSLLLGLLLLGGLLLGLLLRVALARVLAVGAAARVSLGSDAALDHLRETAVVAAQVLAVQDRVEEGGEVDVVLAPVGEGGLIADQLPREPVIEPHPVP